MSMGAFGAGLVGGIVAGEDPRRGARRMAALAFILLALVGLAAAIGLQLTSQHNEFLVMWVFFALFWSWIVMVSVAKWVAFFPFSAFRSLPLLVLAIEQTRAGMVWAIAYGCAWALSIILAATMAPAAVIIGVLILVVAAWGAGIQVGKAEGRVWAQMQEARSVVARALGVAPAALAGGNTGNLRFPVFTFEFPFVASDDNLLSLNQNITGMEHIFVVTGLAREGISLAPLAAAKVELNRQKREQAKGRR